MDDAAAAKDALRADVKARLAALAPARRALEEEIVQAAIQDAPEWKAARSVLVYKAKGREFSVVGLTLAAWRAGKMTCFPRVTPEGLLLQEARGWSELQKSTLGIEEPLLGCPRVEPATVDLAIVPGAAWDRLGGRMGRGGGHYDRLIPQLACPVWGVAFDCQVVAAVPKSAWDQDVARVWSSSLVQENM